MSAFNKSQKSKFKLESESEKELMESNSIFSEEDKDDSMSEKFYMQEYKIKTAIYELENRASKKSLRDDVLEMEMNRIKRKVGNTYSSIDDREKKSKNNKNESKSLISDWRSLPWGFEKKKLLSIDDLKEKKVLSVDEFEKNIDLLINKVNVFLNILSTDTRIHLDIEDMSEENFISKIENAISVIADYLFLDKADSVSKERVYLYFNKKLDGIFDNLKCKSDLSYGGFEYNIKNTLIGAFGSFYINVLPFLKEKPVGRIYPSYKTISKFTNREVLQKSEWKAFAININNEIKESDVKLKVFLTEGFSKFILDDITFYISSTDLAPLVKDINVLNITCNTRLFNKILSNLSNNPYDMTDLIHLTKVLVSSGIWENKDVSNYWFEYLSANPQIIKTTKNLNYLHREDLFKYVKTTEFFWLLFFNAIYDFETNLSRSSVSEDKIQQFFYSFDLLSDVSENWRIPEKYVVDIDGNNNIIKKIVIFTKENNLKLDNIRDKLLNLVRHNHPILLSGSILLGQKRTTLREYLKLNMSEADFNLFFPKDVFKKKWFFFGSTKVENVTPQDNFVYENKQGMKIRFKSVVAPVLTEKDVGNDYSLREQSDILKSWNIHGSSFSEDVFSALESLATKVSNARVFLENYPVYCEEADFIKGRVNHYVVELLVGYSNDFKKQEAMKKISAISHSIDLEKELIKNLGVLQNQIQVSVDKIVKETQEHLSFEAKKMDIFLGYRFPEAVNTKGTKQSEEEELFFDFKR